jgi:hypothetical protein
MTPPSNAETGETLPARENGGVRTKLPGRRGIARNVSEAARSARPAVAAAERIGADRVTRRSGACRRTATAVAWSALGLDDSDSHAQASPAHGSTNSANEVVSERDPASAIRMRLETTENERSRLRGTSNACSTCTQRNNDASGRRA